MKPEERGLSDRLNSDNLNSKSLTTVTSEAGEQSIMRGLADFTNGTWARLNDEENEATPRGQVLNNALYEPLLPKGDKEENLRKAIENCCLEQIKKLVDAGVDINAAYPSGMDKKDAENVFSKLKLLFSDIRKRVLPDQIGRLAMDLAHSEEYVKFSKAYTTLKQGFNFSEKQPAEIVEEIVKNIEMLLSMRSHYLSCRDLKLDNPNTSISLGESEPTIFEKFNAFLTQLEKVSIMQ